MDSPLPNEELSKSPGMDRETPADGDNNGDADPRHRPEADEGEAEPYPISITTEEKPRPKTDQAAPGEEKTNINIEAAAPLRETESTVALTITHPTQTRFTCPACTLTYTTHNSLARHVGVSHERLALDISFKCALCEYVHVNLCSTSSHFRQTHGAVVPPVNVDDAREKVCPFYQRPFPSVRSCSTLIRERHMKDVCEQRERRQRRRNRGHLRREPSGEKVRSPPNSRRL